MKHSNTSPLFDYGLSLIFIALFFPIQLSAQSVNQLIDMSDMAIEEGAYIEALGNLAKVIEKDADNSKALNLRGVCYEKLEQFENAIASYKRAIDSDKKFAEPYYNLGMIYMGFGKEKEAVQLFSKYINLKPKDATGWTQKGVVYLYSNELDSAIFFLNRAIDLDKKADRAFMFRGYSFSLKGDFDRALEDLNQSIKINPAAYNYFVRGDLKMENGDTFGAIEDYTFTLKIDQGLIGARNSRANAYLFSEQYDKCLKDAEKILEIDPENDRAINYQAWAYFYLGDYEHCIAAAKKGKTTINQQYNFDHLLGRAYLRTSQFKKAETAFNDAIILEPSRTDNYQLRAAAILFQNTDLRNLEKKETNYFFKKIKNIQLAQLDQWVKNPTHKYYFPKLKAKYKADFRSLSYDEYFMFYYGFSAQPNYEPYSKTIKQKMKKFDEYFENKNYVSCIHVCEKLLEEYPFVIELYLYAGSAYHKLGNYKKYGEYMFKYHAILESINMTGDGKTPNTAFIITSPSDEYDFLFYLGYNSAEQSLLHENDHDYDVLKISAIDQPKEASFMYFNIDKPFQFLTNKFKKEAEIYQPKQNQNLNVKPRTGQNK